MQKRLILSLVAIIALSSIFFSAQISAAASKRWRLPSAATLLSDGFSLRNILLIGIALIDQRQNPIAAAVQADTIESPRVSETNKPEPIAQSVSPTPAIKTPAAPLPAPTPPIQRPIPERGEYVSVRDLGNLRPLSPYSVATDVNNAKTAVGYAMTANDKSGMHPVIYKNEEVIDIAGAVGIAHAINEKEQVVGMVEKTFNRATGSSVEHAFLWENGSLRDLGALIGASKKSVAYDINENGQVVGYGHIGHNESTFPRAYLWQNNTVKDLGTLGGDEQKGGTTAYAINNLGDVVGCSIARDGLEHPFIWRDGVMKDLGNRYGLGGCAVDINDDGAILGYFYKMNEIFDGQRDIEAFILKEGNTMPLSDMPKGFWPKSINAGGMVIGSSGGGLAVFKNGKVSIYYTDDWRIGGRDDLGQNDLGVIVGIGSKYSQRGDFAFIIDAP